MFDYFRFSPKGVSMQKRIIFSTLVLMQKTLTMEIGILLTILFFSKRQSKSDSQVS
ncbi:hypothetical protein ACFO3G_01880 [Falsiporphyromonas endometrii]|uniref:Uncharacterized protein n=1 Tax=Falsiporphyromonas endometrii TaxID=1387297 RepID=A0ABV9K5V3_9PORP